MKDAATELQGYVESITGSPLRLLSAPAVLERLPMFIAQAYEGYFAGILDLEVILLVRKGRRTPTPGEIANHFKQAKGSLTKLPVFVFNTLPSFDRDRLIRHGVPFIVPYRQMFIPGRLIDLRESRSGSSYRSPAGPPRLSFSTQLLLLYHIQRARNVSIPALHDWAERLHCSRMTVTRACQELATAGLAQAYSRGRTVELRFPETGRRTLWESARPLLRSPVFGRSFVHSRIRSGEIQPELLAGLSALSRFSNLAEPKMLSLAMSKAAFRADRETGKLEVVPYEEPETVLIESWHYAPSVLAEDHVVDRLSLYLSLKDDPDVRVQSALKEMLEDVPW